MGSGGPGAARSRLLEGRGSRGLQGGQRGLAARYRYPICSAPREGGKRYGQGGPPVHSPARMCRHCQRCPEGEGVPPGRASRHGTRRRAEVQESLPPSGPRPMTRRDCPRFGCRPRGAMRGQSSCLPTSHRLTTATSRPSHAPTRPPSPTNQWGKVQTPSATPNAGQWERRHAAPGARRRRCGRGWPQRRQSRAALLRPPPPPVCPGQARIPCAGVPGRPCVSVCGCGRRAGVDGSGCSTQGTRKSPPRG